ncbi:MAG TPA: hypothetical protein VH164_12360, partial [Ktedonobacteraceae bacterium]|nr:hypothetical protein [Ktedonobacteraceae bacterium]
MQKPLHQRSAALLFSLVLACTLLLNACSGSGLVSASSSHTAAPSPTLVPSPTVSPSLQQQGTAQLQAFQQWITLLQQYGGNVDTYQQQYTSDQQALNATSTDDAYQAALDTLNGHVATIKLPALKAEANGLQQKLSQEASTWS